MKQSGFLFLLVKSAWGKTHKMSSFNTFRRRKTLRVLLQHQKKVNRSTFQRNCYSLKKKRAVYAIQSVLGTSTNLMCYTITSVQERSCPKSIQLVFMSYGGGVIFVFNLRWQNVLGQPCWYTCDRGYNGLVFEKQSLWVPSAAPVFPPVETLGVVVYADSDYWST